MYKIIIFLFLTPMLSYAAVENRISVGTAVFKPFMFVEEDGRVEGIFHEYITALLKKTGLEARFETMPLQRIRNHAAKGTFDLIIFSSEVPEAKDNYIEIKQFHKLQVVIFSLDKKVDLKKTSVGIGRPAGTLCPIFNEEDEKQVKFFDFESTEQSIKLLTSNRISAICATREHFKYEIEHFNHKKNKFYEIPNYHHELTFSLFANKHLNADKLKQLVKAAAELDQKKIINTIYKKYGLGEILNH